MPESEIIPPEIKEGLIRLAREMNTLADTVDGRQFRRRVNGKTVIITEQIPTLDIPGTRANRRYRQLIEEGSVKERFSPDR